ncbi:glycerophosphodiester phosphodiesterase family protein [Ornithinimicrobium pratense]|uniref:glycerophosphodiester phosphodiesterase n=1 Tax=Ornithinimicrobium pratense TaxID=2593973 RepID=A0A5J6V4R7_9MICO|nr:glycerophosphodiester phosphodiesterase family protein [Ornithinimicrobium pratense]QFG68121.1 glycerophosphodiester phosphodiesterase [Ornithinimicrobium pratense]
MNTPLVVAHRGASGYRPEQTRSAYELAARMGADLLELDVVPTKDHVLLARHENNLAGTTDIATRPEFADRRATKVVDGQVQEGWFTEDLTLTEVKRLRAVERLPQLRPDSARHDGLEEILTVEEVFDLREQLAGELGRPIGLYPEIKHSAYFARLGLPAEPALTDLLRRFDQDRPDGDVLLHAFEPSSLVTLHHDLGVRARSSLLMFSGGTPGDAGPGDPDYAWWSGPQGMARVRRLGISGVSPDLTMVISIGPGGAMGEDTGLVAAAHAQGLYVHPYTFRAENQWLFTEFRSSEDPAAHGDLVGMVSAFLDVGIDAVNTDHPDLGVRAVRGHTR